MKHVQSTMERFLEEISYCVKNGNRKGVISLMNEMKNFYMTETGMKVPKVKKVPEEKLEVVKAVGSFEEQIPNIKPVRHIFY